jgi:hypothetical protein
MLDPPSAFSIAGTIAMLGWLGLLVSLFVSAVRPFAQWIATIAIPALLAIAYLLLFSQSWGQTPGGGFGSIEAVRALFANDAALTAGWLHYLAFDLFVGAWIVRRSLHRIHAVLVVPCLVLTFLAGPAGLLLFLAIRSATRLARRIAP